MEPLTFIKNSYNLHPHSFHSYTYNNLKKTHSLIYIPHYTKYVSLFRIISIRFTSISQHFPAFLFEHKKVKLQRVTWVPETGASKKENTHSGICSTIAFWCDWFSKRVGISSLYFIPFQPSVLAQFSVKVARSTDDIIVGSRFHRVWNESTAKMIYNRIWFIACIDQWVLPVLSSQFQACSCMTARYFANKSPNSQPTAIRIVYIINIIRTFCERRTMCMAWHGRAFPFQSCHIRCVVVQTQPSHDLSLSSRNKTYKTFDTLTLTLHYSDFCERESSFRFFTAELVQISTHSSLNRGLKS